MKQYIILFLITSLLTACISVEFKDPQPKKGKPLNEYPEEFIGTYTSPDLDTIIVGKTYFISNSLSLETDNKVKTTQKIELSDSVLLKKVGHTFILNMRSKENWSIVIFSKSSNGLTIDTFNANDKEFLAKLKSITKTEEVRDTDGNLKKIILNPTEKEFKKIINTPSLFEKGELIKVQ
jgi:hypothetical protein